MRQETRAFILIILGAASLALWFPLLHGAEEVLHVYVFDVGQGDSIFIETPSGTQMLIDGGPTSKVLSELDRVLPYGDRTIDVVLLTHPQEDHMAGLTAVLGAYDVDRVIANAGACDSSACHAFSDAVKNEVGEATPVASGTRIALGDGVAFDVLAPYADALNDDPNMHMIIGRLIHGTSALLLAGDSTVLDEINLALAGADLSSDVLKVGHHGSRYASTALFLSRVHPAIAAISVGVNRYGHPHPDALRRLKEAGSNILRTDELGTVHLVSRGNHFVLAK